MLKFHRHNTCPEPLSPESQTLSRKLRRLSWASLREFRRRLKSRPVPNKVARSDNPYATHLPILVGLAGVWRIRRVIELGSGLYSTSTFLNRAAFPDLQELRSFENDREWAARVRECVADESRHELTIVQGPMSKVPGQLQFADCDLVFIDDSTSQSERLATIEAVGRSCGEQLVVVIHDYEEPKYRRAASEHLEFMQRHFTFTAFNPNTGVLSNSGREVQRRLREIEQRISSYSSVIELEDSDRWSAVLHGGPSKGNQTTHRGSRGEAENTQLGRGTLPEPAAPLLFAADGETPT